MSFFNIDPKLKALCDKAEQKALPSFQEIDRMVRQYETICKKHNCKAKIFTQMPSCLNKKIGNPDLVVLFTNTVSHKMVRCAVSEAKNKNIEVVRSHSSSQAALTEILEQRCEIA